MNVFHSKNYMSIHEMPFKNFKLYCKSCDNDEERKKLFKKIKRICPENIENNDNDTQETNVASDIGSDMNCH